MIKELWARLRALLPRREPVEYQYKWVRTHLYGEPDEANVLRHERSGWEPVPDNEIPVHLAPERTPKEKWAPNGLLNAHERNSYGGLRLYRLSKPEAEERERYILDNSAAWRKTDQTLDPYGGYVYDFIDNKGSLREQINEYYSEANRKEHPERQQESEDSERRLQAKGLSFN